MIADHCRGLGAYHSRDAMTWTPHKQDILASPRTGLGNQAVGNQAVGNQAVGKHVDVLVRGDHAYLFYLTHPNRRGQGAGLDSSQGRGISIHVVELDFRDGLLMANRDQPPCFELPA